MNFSARQDFKQDSEYPRIKKIEVNEEVIKASLDDGREISIPIAWSERLSSASKEQIENFDIDPYGYGIHWPDVDEDISIKAFIDGWG